MSLFILLAACFCSSVFFYITRNYFIDDAFIGFRYITNFLSGKGFVFNPGQRVEGITNIGWLLFLTPLARFFEVPLCAKFVGYFCDLGSLCIATLLALPWPVLFGGAWVFARSLSPYPCLLQPISRSTIFP